MMSRFGDSSAVVQLAVALALVGSAAAQNTNGGTTATQPANTQPANTQPANTQTNAQTNTNAATQTNAPAQTTNTANTNAATGTASRVTITGIDTASRATGGSTPSTFGGISDLPTIAGYGIPTPVVPWTGAASFMQKSSLPEGTVFICVGALLGFMAAAVLAWRGIVAWSLHRSVKRANAKQFPMETSKLTKGGYAAHAGSNMSLDRLAAPTGKRITSRSPLAQPPSNSSGALRNSSLFFSPTAGAGHHSSPAAAGLLSSGNRSSNFLPAGYYAAPGAAAPAAGAGTMHVGNNRATYMRQHNFGPSPPSSPGLPPSRGHDRAGGGLYAQPSTSSLNLNIPGGAHPGGRAPSANLEDLFAHQPPTHGGR